nr:pseudouridine synthase [Pedobacter indicus]
MPFDNKRNSRDGRSNKGGKSNYFKKEDRYKRDSDSSGKRGERTFNKRDRYKSFDKDTSKEKYSDDKRYQKVESGKRKRVRSRSKNDDRAQTPTYKTETIDDGLIRLNRYIANAGVCSRRKADELIEAGVISINGEIVTSLGTKVDPTKDEVGYNGERLRREKLVYVLLNKPKDYITTTDDPQERKTVMHLVQKASKERIYPVGRLDRNTTGLLLMTNDGDLADKLSHPRNTITKIYHVELNKNLTQGDFNKIEYGLELEDGFIKPDSVSFIQGAGKNEVGIQIHSGKNRIVRRIFEHLQYDVIKLDRVIYANLTKKDLPRGRWRHLEEKEVIQLKHFVK